MTHTSQTISPKHVQAAKASWMAPLIAIILNVTVGNSSEDRSIKIVVAFVALAIIAIGLLFAIWAVVGAFRLGPRRILVPACIGLFVNGFLIFATINTVLLARQIAEQRRTQQEAAASDEWIPNGRGWHVDRGAGFAIQLPDDWEVVSNPQEHVAVMALSPPESDQDTFRENMTIATAHMPQQMSPDSFLANELDLLRKNTVAYEEYGTGTKTHGRLKWSWVAYRQVVQETESRVICHIAVRNGRVYVVSCAGHPDRFQEFQEQFDKSIASIQTP